MKHILYIITIAIGFSSCSEYQKVFRKDDIAPKYALGEKLYNEGKYKKAQNLFAQIAPNYRSGKAGAEKLMYMYGNTFYLQEDWNGAAYQLERFTKAYSRSEKLEEMAFKAAKSPAGPAPTMRTFGAFKTDLVAGWYSTNSWRKGTAEIVRLILTFTFNFRASIERRSTKKYCSSLSQPLPFKKARKF